MQSARPESAQSTGGFWEVKKWKAYAWLLEYQRQQAEDAQSLNWASAAFSEWVEPTCTRPVWRPKVGAWQCVA